MYGYDTEELYFEKVNRELILNLKKQQPSQEDTPPPAEAHPGAKVIPFPERKPQSIKKAA